jgi:hypothetical protein
MIMVGLLPLGVGLGMTFSAGRSPHIFIQPVVSQILTSTLIVHPVFLVSAGKKEKT